MQRHFPVTVACSNPEISAIKSQNGVVENYVFRSKNFFGGKDPQNQMRTFYAPIGTHQVGKFGAITPTGHDDIGQSTPDFWPPDFWPIFEFQVLKNCWGQTHPQ